MDELEFDRETDGRWIAEAPKLPGVLAYGATQDEARHRAMTLALRVIADQMETIQELARARGWQPIETAPKDRAILLWNGHVNIGEWGGVIEDWLALIDGDIVAYDAGDLARIRAPTLWKPLPEPPE